MIEYTDLELFLEDLKNELPHGSGIDADWDIVKHRAASPTTGIVIFSNSYHTMTDLGYYDGWLDFSVIYSYDMTEKRAHHRRLTTPETSWMVQGECGNCGGHAKVKCYECGGDGTLRDDDDEVIDCPDCAGEGEIKCPECDEEGNVEYDDLPQLLEYLDACFDNFIQLEDE